MSLSLSSSSSKSKRAMVVESGRSWGERLDRLVTGDEALLLLKDMGEDCQRVVLWLAIGEPTRLSLQNEEKTSA